MIAIGTLAAIVDYDDYSTLYSFIATGHTSAANMSLSRDFARRESVLAIPGADGVFDGYGRNGGPMDRRDATFSFRVFVDGGDLDAAYDLLAAAIAPGRRTRLKLLKDSGAVWFTPASNPRIQHTLTSANSWGHGGYCDFTVTWRIAEWSDQFSQASDVWGVADGVWGVADGAWGGAYVIALTNTVITFTLDATGTAGKDLPTLPDSGPVITITGPYGGIGGILLTNSTASSRDTTGTSHAVIMGLPFQAATANDQYVLDCGKQLFTFRGVPFRPFKAGPWQHDYFRVDPGKANLCSIACVGTSPTTTGSLLVDWRKKYA